MKAQHRVLIDLGFGAIGVALIMIGIMCSCGPGQNFNDKPVRRAHDGGISFFPELEKINAHCKKWAQGRYAGPTGVVKYEYCVEW